MQKIEKNQVEYIGVSGGDRRAGPQWRGGRKYFHCHLELVAAVALIVWHNPRPLEISMDTDMVWDLLDMEVKT